MFILEIDRGQVIDSFDMFGIHFSKYNSKTKVYVNITLWEENDKISINHSSLEFDRFEELFRI